MIDTEHVHIEVHYKVRLHKDQFKKVYEQAKSTGCDFNDAGPIETVRRYLMSEGIDNCEMDCGLEPVKYEKLA